MQPVKMSILGTGAIAEKMAATISEMHEIELYAVASRSLDKAEAFAQKHGFKKRFGSYEELAQDPTQSLVYIASPHSHHYEHAALCLNGGKHVLCEKPFTLNAGQAKELLLLAQKHNLLLAEAIWPRYNPLFSTLRRLLASGIIGQPKMVQSALGFPMSHIERMYSPSLAGGACMDLAVYPITFACLVFGSEVESITSSCSWYPTGVDASNATNILFKNGGLASLQTSMVCNLGSTALVFGERGHLALDSVTNYSEISVYNHEGSLIETHPCHHAISGYEYEVQACVRALAQGQTECPEMPHSEIIRVMEILDEMRRQWGLVYPGEGSAS